MARLAGTLLLLLAFLAVKAEVVSRRSAAQTTGESFLFSPMMVSDVGIGEVIAKSAFSSKSCSVDVACMGDEALPYRQAVVQITHPLKGNFCTGTLIRGPDPYKVYVLTAWHCVAIDQITFSYTWSSHAVLFNYRVPCNTTQLSETGSDFENLGVVQGLSLVWIDRETDTALFELLSDIPPEVGATLQGWDSRGIDVSDDEQKFWFNINHPSGDMAKFTSGVMVRPVYSELFSSDSSIVVDSETPCTGAECGFHYTLTQVGTLEGGSSGSGFLESETGRLVGVLSGGSGDYCGIPDLDDLEEAYRTQDNVGFDFFARLEKAWGRGLWEHLGGSGPEDKLYKDLEEYSMPSPGITVINPAPLYIQGGLQQSLVIILTDPPTAGPTEIKLSVPGQQLVQLLPDTLTFDSSNYFAPQTVNIVQGPELLPDGSPPTSFDILLEWPVATKNSVVTRKRVLKGVYKVDVKGSDFSNPILLRTLPEAGTVDMGAYTTEDEFITQSEGPFIPSVFFTYTAPEALGLKLKTCPMADSNYRPVTQVMDEQRAFYSLLPQAAGFDGQCYYTYALLEAQTSYNFLAYPSFNFSQPGEVAGLQGSLEYNFSTAEPITLVTFMADNGLIGAVDSLPYRDESTVRVNGDPTLYLLSAADTMLLDISTCDKATNAKTVLAMIDAATLAPIRVDNAFAGLASTRNCGQIIGAAVEAGKSYLIVVGQDGAQTKLSRGEKKFVLTVKESESRR